MTLDTTVSLVQLSRLCAHQVSTVLEEMRLCTDVSSASIVHQGRFTRYSVLPVRMALAIPIILMLTQLVGLADVVSTPSRRSLISVQTAWKDMSVLAERTQQHLAKIVTTATNAH